MNDENLPYLINFAFLIAGIALTKIYEHLYQKWGLDKKEATLLEELEDIRERLEEILFYYEKQLKVFALGGLEARTVTKVPNKIFNTIYVDVAPKLNASQRKSFIFIHEYVNSVNMGIDKLTKTLADTEDFTEQFLEKWGEMLKVNHLNVAMTIWHTDYHLKNKEHPLLNRGQPANYQSGDEFVDEMKARVEKLIEDAKENLSRDDFE